MKSFNILLLISFLGAVLSWHIHYRFSYLVFLICFYSNLFYLLFKKLKLAEKNEHFIIWLNVFLFGVSGPALIFFW